MAAEAGFAQHFPNAFIGGRGEGVNVEADGAPKKERGLRDDRNVLSQRMQPHPQSVMSAHFILRSGGGLHDAEDGLNNRGLPRACASHDADFGVGLHTEAEVSKHEGEAGPISG